MKTRTIRQGAWFKASPHDVYELLMDSRKHSKLAGGGACSISRKVGGKFSISDGYITGENLELVPDKRIVQHWKAQEDCWPSDHYSKVTFLLRPTKGGTWIAFTQSGVPSACGDRFDSGWQEYYWTPMKGLLEKAQDDS